MKLKDNEVIPEINFFKITKDGPKKLSTKEVFNNKKVILVGVPGAFTPTCSIEHLPGFIKKKELFFSKGIDQIIFLSVNDPFVMHEWALSKSENEILFLSDAYGEFREKTGMSLDLTVIGLGKRLSRFCMIVKDSVVEKIFDENGGGLDKSSAENVLNFL